jgi:hypothetical protein
MLTVWVTERDVKYLIYLAILIVLFSLSIPVLADSPAPEWDYIVEVGDGQFVFVMLSIPGDRTAYGQGGAIQDEEIRAKYNRSGLYHNDDTVVPIWTVNWYAFRVDITFDGKHLVRWGPWAFFDNYDELALEFYENGQLLKTYLVSDIVSDPEKLPHSVSHYTWAAEAEFDENQKKLFLKTENGEEYLFDVTTGGIIPDVVAVEPKAKLATMWATIKQLFRNLRTWANGG